MILRYILCFAIALQLGCAEKVTVFDHINEQNLRLSTDNYPETDARVNALIAPYKMKLDAEMNEVIGVSKFEMKKGSPESRMGNWFADMLIEEAQEIDDRVSFAVQNRGGLRINVLPKGDIMKGKIYELMPFDNFLVIMESDGKVMKDFLTHVASDGGWPVSREVKIELQDTIVTSITLNGDEIDNEKTYYYAIPDYIANGGSDTHMLKNVDRTNTGVMIRDLAIKNIRKQTAAGKQLGVELDGRISRKSKK